MSNFIDQLVTNKMSKTEGTGPLSRILSMINIMLLIASSTLFIKNHDYILFAILLSLSFIPYAYLLNIGIVVYLFVNHQWLMGSLILLYVVSGVLGSFLGMKNIRKNLWTGKTDIDPFEGMYDLFYLIIIHSIFLVLAIFLTGTLSLIFWILFFLIILYEIQRYNQRLSSPWRRLHFPLMIRYSGVAGFHMRKQIENEHFDFDAVFFDFVKNIYPSWEDRKITLFLETVDKQMNSFAKTENLKSFLGNVYNKVDETRIQPIIQKIQETLIKKNPRWIIAEIIKRDYNENERNKYILSFLNGKAD